MEQSDICGLKSKIDFQLETFSKNIENNTNFSFTKFGDGEFECIIYKKGQNCDGNIYTEELSNKLEHAFFNLCQTSDVYIGKWYQSCPSIIDIKNYTELILQKIEFKATWSFYDILSQSKEHPYNHLLKSLFKQIKFSNRKKIFVGPSHMKNSTKLFNCNSYIEVLPKNAFNEYNNILDLCTLHYNENCIFILTCGFSSRCLVSDINKIFSNKQTCLDFGSGLDPFFNSNITRDSQPPINTIIDYYSDFLNMG